MLTKTAFQEKYGIAVGPNDRWTVVPDLKSRGVAGRLIREIEKTFDDVLGAQVTPKPDSALYNLTIEWVPQA